MYTLSFGRKIESVKFHFYFLDIDDCHSDPCENGATCTDAVNDYTCACMTGYYGKSCS